MMFLIRSAFWLSIVVAHMPLDQGEALRAVDQTQGAILAGAAKAITAKCAQDAASCRAILVAGAAALTQTPQPATRPVAAGKTRPPSANSLQAADLTPPWRGRPAKSGA